MSKSLSHLISYQRHLSLYEIIAEKKHYCLCFLAGLIESVVLSKDASAGFTPESLRERCYYSGNTILGMASYIEMYFQASLFYLTVLAK